jgi:hypothetical protein
LTNHLHYAIIIIEREVNNMTTKTYYVENTTELYTALAHIDMLIDCSVEREPIEMNWSELTIQARDIDFPLIERLLAPAM